MKKFFTLLFTVLLPIAVRAAYPVPYFSNMTEGESISEDWVAIDVDDDFTYASYTKLYQNCWAYPSISVDGPKFTKGNYVPGLIIKCAAGIAANDYLISPSISLKANTKYRVRFAYYTIGAGKHMMLKGILAKNRTVAAAKVGTEIFDADYCTADTWHRDGYSFEVAEDGNYNIAFFAHTSIATSLLITDFSVEEEAFIPASPSDVSLKVGTTDNPRACEVNLDWKNPTTDRDEKAFGENQKLESINIYRDNDEKPVCTLKNGETSWTDNDQTGLNAGYHNYKLTATVSGVESEPIEIYSNYVGEVVPFNIPGEVRITDQNDFTLLWGTDKGATHNNTGFWKFVSNTSTGNSAYLLTTASTTSKPINLDNWVFTPEFDFKEAGTYSITLDFTIYKTSKPTIPIELELALGKGQTLDENGAYPDAIMISSNLPYTYTSDRTAIKRDPLMVNVDKPGKYTVGMHAKGKGNGCTYLLYGVSVNKEAGSGLKEIAANKALLNYANGLLSISGDATMVEIYSISGMKVANYTNVNSAIDLSNLQPGVYVIRATAIDGTTEILKLAK